MTLKVVTSLTSEQNKEAIELAKERYNQGTPIEFYDLIDVLDLNSLTATNKKDIALLYDKDPKEITNIARSVAKNNELRTALGTVPKDEYEFVDTLLERWKTRMTFQGMFTIDTPYDLGEGFLVNRHELDELNRQERIKVEYTDPKRITLKEILAKIIFQNRKLNLPFNEKELTNALDLWVYRRKNELSSDVMMKVAYESPVLEELAEPEWDRFVAAITDQNPAEAKCVMKHFIWQVKRKMFGLPVKYHMMVVLFGAQEAGKSTVARDYLCAPVEDFFASVNFQDITDSRNHDIWNNYVLFLDEMGRSFVTNLEDIKRKVTEDKFNSRILTKNSDTVVVNRATFIGTTNKDISRLIFDDTGMRRFYQIDCLDRLDWSVTQTVDYLRLWRSVNEHAETPLLANTATLQAIKKLQNSKRQITMIERWLRERDHQPFLTEKILSTAFFEEFVKFEQANTGTGRSDTNINAFGRTILDIAKNIPALEVTRHRDATGMLYKVTYQGNVNGDLE